MAERSLRGMSIGAKSLESDDNVDFAPMLMPLRLRSAISASSLKDL